MEIKVCNLEVNLYLYPRYEVNFEWDEPEVEPKWLALDGDSRRFLTKWRAIAFAKKLVSELKNSSVEYFNVYAYDTFKHNNLYGACLKDGKLEED